MINCFRPLSGGAGIVKFIGSILLLALAGSASAADDFACVHGNPHLALGKFTFEIVDRATAFDKPTAFRLCQTSGKASLLIRTKVGGRMKVRAISLTEEQTSHLDSLYEAALGANFKDDDIGLDGSSWCLETARGSNSLKACFWSPTSGAEKRGLAAFAVLGTALWNLADFGNTNGRLD